MKALLSILVLCSLSWQALAENVGYEVEVIVFEDISGVFDHAEQWDATRENIELLRKQKAGENPNADKAGKKPRFEWLNPEQFRLNSQAQRLDKHPDYRVLIHTGWKQQGLDRDQAFPVALDSRQLAAEGSDAATPGSDYVTGEITLVMSRYLHVNSQLELFKHNPAPLNTFTNVADPNAVNGNEYQSFPVDFERRMRSREIHYLDHPLVGMIVMATPFKIEAAKPAAAPPNYKTM